MGTGQQRGAAAEHCLRENTERGKLFSQRSLVKLWVLENTSSSPQNASKYFQLHAGNKTKTKAYSNTDKCQEALEEHLWSRQMETTNLNIKGQDVSPCAVSEPPNLCIFFQKNIFLF